MPYPILTPDARDERRSTKCALTVMAKAPRPGKVKTRLCPPMTSDESAALNICFLKDTTENLAAVAEGGMASGLISYTPAGDEHLFEGLLPEDFGLVLQRGGDFGERLHAAAEDILALGFGSVCLIDSDSPTVPMSAYADAVAALQRSGDRIVLGPSHDGGYYLIGMKRAHREPFQNIHWSTATVFAETVAAADAAGLEVVRLPLWYDVDDGATLDILSAELLDQAMPDFATVRGYQASHTRDFLLQRREAGAPA